MREMVLKPSFHGEQGEAAWKTAYEAWLELIVELEMVANKPMERADFTALLYAGLPEILKTRLDSSSTEYDENFGELQDAV